MTKTRQNYDLIGDIHGHAEQLIHLLEKLDYQKQGNVYQHPQNKLIFLGDLIDRGSQQKQVIDIVKAMVAAGSAYCVMGNHEYNAVCFHSVDRNGKPLRPHSEKNIKQHQQFLHAYPDPQERKKVIDWFKTLPIFLEFSGFRVVHACWDEQSIDNLSPFLDQHNGLTEQGWQNSSIEGNKAYQAIETLLKGPEAELPEGVSFEDKEKIKRTNARIKWWKDASFATRERLFLGDNLQNKEKLQTMVIDQCAIYPPEQKPVFIGHYWLKPASIEPLHDNVACLDYSVAKKGKLVAYRWQGEKKLLKAHFVY